MNSSSGQSGLPPAPPLPTRVRHEHHGASIEIPREWEDEAIFSAHPPGPPPQPSISLVRSTVAATMTLELYASRKVAELSGLLGQVLVEDTRETVLGGQRGIAIRLRFEQDGARFVQRIALTLIPGVAYFLTGFALESQAAKLDAAFDNVMQSFRLSTPSRTLPSIPR